MYTYMREVGTKDPTPVNGGDVDSRFRPRCVRRSLIMGSNGIGREQGSDEEADPSLRTRDLIGSNQVSFVALISLEA